MDVIAKFRALHASGCFVMPNPWDAGSAVLLARLGYKALATTSAGFAFTLGLPDDVWAIPKDAVIEHARTLARATPLPVNVDFQSGYARDAEGVAANVTECVATGAAGLSIEDATGDAATPLYDRAVALDRLRAARRAIDASGKPVVLTARCEAYLVGAPDAAKVALDRLAAYAEAGADCLFAPGVRDPKEIAAMVKTVAPKPVNVLASRPGLTVAQLGDLGVRRISVGSALSRVAWGAFLKAAGAIAKDGTFDAFAEIAQIDQLNHLFEGRERGADGL
jgi:2-methylisocitrate lyase-like PEP mutase family enzyme